MPTLPFAQIRFNRCAWDAEGRNGFTLSTGLHLRHLDDATIMIGNINTKGDVSAHLRLVFPKTAIPLLIKSLESLR